MPTASPGSSRFDFPIKLNETTRAYFERAADQESGQMAADMRSVTSSKPTPRRRDARLSAIPFYNAQLRTTCVATMLEGGHAANALPQVARAHVNCRVLPGEPAEEVRDTLVRVLADEQITVTQLHDRCRARPPPLNPEVMRPSRS